MCALNTVWRRIVFTHHSRGPPSEPRLAPSPFCETPRAGQPAASSAPFAHPGEPTARPIHNRQEELFVRGDLYVANIALIPILHCCSIDEPRRPIAAQNNRQLAVFRVQRMMSAHGRNEMGKGMPRAVGAWGGGGETK